MNYKTNLTWYQQEAIEKLSKQKVGALFLDMGLGKTFTALKLFEKRLLENKVNKAVVLLPISTKASFVNEAIKHLPSLLDKIIIYGVDSISQSTRIMNEVARIIDNKTYLIIDESTFIKNDKAKRSNLAYELSKLCEYKLLLTGNPITKFVKDLYSQFLVLSPKILGYKNFDAFKDVHLTYNTQTGMIIASSNVEYLSKLIEPFIYSKTIEEVEKMSEKKYKEINYQLNYDDRAEYEELKKSLFEKYKDDDRLQGDFILALLNKLQHSLHKKQRLEILKNTVENIGNEKIIIFCKYTNSLEDIADLYPAESCLMNGIHKHQEHFISGRKRILITNIQVGSHAQNFQFCHNTIFYENSFDYDKRLQAERRTWRKGQENDCNYYSIKSDVGLESFIFNCLERKKNLLQEFNLKIKENGYAKSIGEL